MKAAKQADDLQLSQDQLARMQRAFAKTREEERALEASPSPPVAPALIFEAVALKKEKMPKLVVETVKRHGEVVEVPFVIPDPKRVKPAERNNPEGEDLRKKTAIWIVKNPEYWKMIRLRAEEFVAAGKHVSIHLIVEAVKYENALYSKLKMSNDLRPYISRALAAVIPGYEALVDFKETAW